MRKSWLYTMILAVLFSCTQVEESDKTIRQWHYEDGTLKKEQEYINDSIEHGIYRYFYSSGVLKDSAQITHNKFHGKRFEYHENGDIHGLSTYINNKYRNGITYRSDGTLEYYRANNYHEELMFIIHYDSLGNPVKYEGNPIFSWVQEKDYPIGKEFSIELLVADPPNCKTEVSVNDWDLDKNQAISETIYKPDQFNRVNYSRKQDPNKDLYILHVALITDTIEQTTISDTLIIVVDRKGRSFFTRHLSEL